MIKVKRREAIVTVECYNNLGHLENRVTSQQSDIKIANKLACAIRCGIYEGNDFTWCVKMLDGMEYVFERKHNKRFPAVK